MTQQTPVRKVCVFCGSSFGDDPCFSKEASELGSLLAEENNGLVYGGGTTGLMGCVAKAVADAGQYVHGIIPEALVSKERKKPGDIEKINDELKDSVENHDGTTPLDDSYGVTTVVTDMHTRKELMAQEADCFVALPGGFGTLEELMEITTWSQLGIHAKPIVLLNINHFYDEFIEFVRGCIKRGFISKENGKIVSIATSPMEVIECLNNYKAPNGRFHLDWSNK